MVLNHTFLHNRPKSPNRQTQKPRRWEIVLVLAKTPMKPNASNEVECTKFGLSEFQHCGPALLADSVFIGFFSRGDARGGSEISKMPGLPTTI